MLQALELRHRLFGLVQPLALALVCSFLRVALTQAGLPRVAFLARPNPKVVSQSLQLSY